MKKIFNLNKCTIAKNDYRYNRMGGVYFDPKGYAVATNGRLMAVKKDNDKDHYKGCTVDKNGNKLSESFPNWSRVLPDWDDLEPVNYDFEALGNLLKSEKDFIKGCKKMSRFQCVNIGGTYIDLSFAEIMLDFKACENVALYRQKKNSMLILVDKNDETFTTLLEVMPLDKETVENDIDGKEYKGFVFRELKLISESSRVKLVGNDAIEREHNGVATEKDKAKLAIADRVIEFFGGIK